MQFFSLEGWALAIRCSLLPLLIGIRADYYNQLKFPNYPKFGSTSEQVVSYPHLSLGDLHSNMF